MYGTLSGRAWGWRSRVVEPFVKVDTLDHSLYLGTIARQRKVPVLRCEPGSARPD